MRVPGLPTAEALRTVIEDGIKVRLKLKYPPIAIPQDTYDRLPERAKQLFRLENIGAPALAY